jgi:hypothetical protein
MQLSIEIPMHLNQKFNQKKVSIQRDVTVKNQGALKNIVNVTKVVLLVQTYVFVKVVRTVKPKIYLK